jgi:hypothetical protein
MPFKDSRLGPGTLKFGSAEFGHQAAAVRLTPSVNSEDGTPTLALPDPAPLTTISWALNLDAIQDFEESTARQLPWQRHSVRSRSGPKHAGRDEVLRHVRSSGRVGGDVAVRSSRRRLVIGDPTRLDECCQ